MSAFDPHYHSDHSVARYGDGPFYMIEHIGYGATHKQRV